MRIKSITVRMSSTDARAQFKPKKGECELTIELNETDNYDQCYQDLLHQVQQCTQDALEAAADVRLR